ncbi:unnamed protein product [Ixodes pacificus]
MLRLSLLVTKFVLKSDRIFTVYILFSCLTRFLWMCCLLRPSATLGRASLSSQFLFRLVICCSGLSQSQLLILLQDRSLSTWRQMFPNSQQANVQSDCTAAEPVPQPPKFCADS